MDVLQKIRDAGFSLWVDGDDLIISPSSKLTDEQRTYLKMHKAAVIERLKREAPLESATTSPPPDGSQPPQHYTARAFLYSVIRDGGVERATLVSQDIRTEPEALAFLRQRFPWLKVQWTRLVTHPVCSGCRHYTGGVLCNADQSPDRAVSRGSCGRYVQAGDLTREHHRKEALAAGEQPVSHRKETAGRRAANLCALNIKPEEEPTRGGQENASVIEDVLEGVLEERPKTGRQWVEEAERLVESSKHLAEEIMRDAAMRRWAEANTYPLCVCCIHYAGTGLCSRGRVPAFVSQAKHCPVREVRL